MAKKKAGRPTKYTPEMCGKVDEYLAIATKENMHLPKKVSFAQFIGVNKTTLYEWEKKHPIFSNALRKIDDFQEERLVDDGIYGGKEVNPTIIKLLLGNNYGYMETNKKILQGDDTGGAIKIELVEADNPLSELSEMDEASE